MAAMLLQLPLGNKTMRPPYTWLITDTHWNHDAIIEFENRPPDFKERTIRALKRFVAAQDTLIHLGDVIFYDYPSLRTLMASFPGTKVLVRGNHDHKPASWYQRNGFHFAADAIQLGDVLFTHIPQECVPPGVVNVHGHWHSNAHRAHEKLAWYSENVTHFLLSLEAENYQPVNLAKWLPARRSLITSG